VATVLTTIPSAAQQSSTLSGRVVRAGSNAAIPEAEVTIEPQNLRAVTDAAGEFRFDGLSAGYVFIHVRRIGFLPESLGVTLPLAAPIDIELRVAPQQLDTVTVKGPEEPIVRGKLAGFYERKRFGIGRHLEAKDFERMTTRQLADILQSRVPGIRIMRSRRGGSAAYVYSTRLGTGCYPSVYLDGVAVYRSTNQVLGGGAAAASALFDINLIDPGHVAALEYYAGPSQMPAQYNSTGSACGALLIWTK
jgi:hypothetical protein